MKRVSDVYENLYHYTTWDGLLGIIKSQCLWATHYRFLNDFSEIILFRERLINLMLPHVRQKYNLLIQNRPDVAQKIKQKGSLEQVILQETELYVDYNYKAVGEEIYILSFCGEHKCQHVNRNGLLSQWRGYGTGGGFAIVLNTKKLEEMLITEMQTYDYGYLFIADLVYSNDDSRLSSETAEDLAVLADDVNLLFDHKKLPTEETRLEGYYPFVRCISRYKHLGFCEENEVRVVALPTVINKEITELAKRDGAHLKPEKENKFRDKDNGLVPYIELFNSDEIKLPIEKIIVGPHKEKESKATALRVMLKHTEIEVLCSDIPFVG